MSVNYLEPGSIYEALALLAEYGSEAKVIAGGTAVMLMLQQKLIAPEILISLERLPDLDSIRKESKGLFLGPRTLIGSIERSAVINQGYRALATACHKVGNVRIRNQATIGGNLAEADYASDPPTALLALDASVKVSSLTGSRTLPLREFFLGFYTTALEGNELITGIFIPELPAHSQSTYIDFKSRSTEDRPCVGVAALATFDEDICIDLRVAVGAACDAPRRLLQVEAQARGVPLTDQLIGDIAEGYAEGIETLDDLRGSAWYRTEMIRIHVKRALQELRNDHR